ncbi:MAG: FHA domain-containing protein [Lentisphaerales bacterium]|nr:FHA domain-containing protein [Lentisphaerales bacterium]
MEQIQTFPCPHCGAINDKTNVSCSSCKELTTLAFLKSRGTGNAPKDFIWPLFPYDMTIGSGTSNDIAIPSNRLEKKHCSLIFQNDSFFLERTSKENPVLINGHNIQLGVKQKLTNGTLIKLGLDELKITYHKLSQSDMNIKTEKERIQLKLDKEYSVNQTSNRLMLLLGYLQELHSSTDIKELLSSSVDAVLKLTGLDRGYAFITEQQGDQLGLQEVVSRKLGGLDLKEQDYKISKSMLLKVLQGDGSVIIEDADAEASSSNSMRDFKIKSLVCLPLNKINPETKEKTLLGIIYADKMMATTSLPQNTKTTLQMLIQMIIANIDRCMTFQNTTGTCQQYNDYFANLSDELATIHNNLKVISENMEKSQGKDSFKSLAQYLTGEQQKMNTIIQNVNEAVSN